MSDGMNRAKLMQNPLPIDRLARRVVAKAKPEDLWSPKPNGVDEACQVAVLRTAKLPSTAPRDLLGLIGFRRGRMTLLGYAEQQASSKSAPAKWVARCDCGNYEHRIRIRRWAATVDEDMCHECQKRRFLLGKEEWAKQKAHRPTVESS